MWQQNQTKWKQTTTFIILLNEEKKSLFPGAILEVPLDGHTVQFTRSWLCLLLPFQREQHMMMLIISDYVNPESTPGLMFARMLSFSRLVRPETKMLAGSWGMKVCLERRRALVSLSDFIRLSRKSLDANKGKSSSLYSLVYLVCIESLCMSVKIY